MMEIKNVVKRYGDKSVVDNVSIKIEEGKITSIIGPNGAGKSTLLSIVSRIISKNQGEVFIDGKELSQWNNNELSKKFPY